MKPGTFTELMEANWRANHNETNGERYSRRVKERKDAERVASVITDERERNVTAGFITLIKRLVDPS